jgi:hypothetical protein
VAERFSRRDFLKAAVRFAAFAGIGTVALRLLHRRPGGRTPAAGSQTCVNEGYCKTCGAFAGCGLPAALSARQRAPWARGRT